MPNQKNSPSGDEQRDPRLDEDQVRGGVDEGDEFEDEEDLDEEEDEEESTTF